MRTRIRSLGTAPFLAPNGVAPLKDGPPHSTGGVRSEDGRTLMSDRPGDRRTLRRDQSCQVMPVQLNDLGARAVIGVDGAVWSANSAFCSLVGLEESSLRRLGWRRLLHSADRRYVAAHLVEVLAGGDHLREFDARLVPPDGHDVPARIRVELVRDGSGRQGCFLVEAWA